LFEVLANYIKENQLPYPIVPVNKFTGKTGGKFLSLFYILWQLLLNIRHYDLIMINVSQGGIRILFPIVWVFSKMTGKKMALRAFGGHLNETIKQSFHKRLLYYMLSRANVIFVESKLLVSTIKKINRNTYWFPNCRKQPEFTPDLKKKYNHRFVFISHVKRSKGIMEILDVFDDLPDIFSVEIYGPVMENEAGLIRNDKRYKGVLEADGVSRVLQDCDVLLLPTYYEGEGYPGIILEAYAYAVPCIATRWLQIPEIVEDGKTGILIEPKDKEALKTAILSIDQEKLAELRKGAFAKSKEFDADLVHKKMFDLLVNAK